MTRDHLRRLRAQKRLIEDVDRLMRLIQDEASGRVCKPREATEPAHVWLHPEDRDLLRRDA